MASSHRTSWWRLLLIGSLLALNLAPRPHLAARAWQSAQRLLPIAPAAALADLERAHRAWPERADVALLAAEAAWAAKDPARAVAYYQHAARLAPLPPWAYIHWATALRDLGHPQKALQTLQAGLRQHPEALNLLQTLADHATALDDYATARQALTQTLALQPTPSLRWQLALLTAAEAPQEALSHLHALADDPIYGPNARTLRDALQAALRAATPAARLTSSGQALLRVGALPQARHAFRRALALDPTNPTTWAYLGETLRLLGEDPLPALRQAHHLAPNAPLPNLLLGLYWLDRDAPARALPWLQAAHRAAPQDAYTLLWLAQALVRLPGSLPQALEALAQGGQRAPHDAVYWREYATLMLNLHLPPEQTLPITRRAAALAPNDPTTLTLLGRALLEAEDLTTAERLLRTALARDPGHPDAHLYLGLLLLRRGQTEQARQHLLWAAQLATPSSPTAQLAQRLLQRYFTSARQ